MCGLKNINDFCFKILNVFFCRKMLVWLVCLSDGVLSQFFSVFLGVLRSDAALVCSGYQRRCSSD